MKSKEFATATDIFFIFNKKRSPETSELLYEISIV